MWFPKLRSSRAEVSHKLDDQLRYHPVEIVIRTNSLGTVIRDCLISERDVKRSGVGASEMGSKRFAQPLVPLEYVRLGLVQCIVPALTIPCLSSTTRADRGTE